MLNAKILEIFRSVQGEGKYLGATQVFVRFFECNMHCVWCDTPHSIGDTTRRYKEFSFEKLIHEIDRLWDNCHSVSLTGGEPLLQAQFIKDLLPKLEKKGRAVYLETNGIFYEELAQIIDGVDMIAMDIKLPTSTQCQSYWQEHERFLKIAKTKDVFIKAVVSSQTQQKDVEKAAQLVAAIDPRILFIIQPNSFDLANGVMKKCLAYQNVCLNKLKDVRILPQMHRIMKLR